MSSSDKGNNWAMFRQFESAAALPSRKADQPSFTPWTWPWHRASLWQCSGPQPAARAPSCKHSWENCFLAAWPTSWHLPRPPTVRNNHGFFRAALSVKTSLWALSRRALAVPTRWLLQLPRCCPTWLSSPGAIRQSLEEVVCSSLPVRRHGLLSPGVFLRGTNFLQEMRSRVMSYCSLTISLDVCRIPLLRRSSSTYSLHLSYAVARELWFSRVFHSFSSSGALTDWWC
mmetsp:Transcript_16520/g.26422  ORF Transcript_16520/g.26422 Transcript_16520/m.26422 type:complete len:229 (+) Transcript_16520:153-839(+)